MCGRYWLDLSEDDTDVAVPGVKRAGEVVPGDHIPVLCQSRSGIIRNFGMQWGWHLSGGKLLINCRSETIGDKQLYNDSIAHRRCLLPMSAYFEWHKRGRDKIKYRIYPDTKETCYLAALYRWEDTVPAVSILTRDAAEEISFIHDRMPVIIPLSISYDWLTSNELKIPDPIKMDFSLAI